ncbi:MAG: hypothetical protein RDU83_02330 [bacterium]|nr:hypothetical protein [bacterium]
MSPDCANAHVLLAEESARTLEQARGLCAQGAAAGKRALGERAFKEDAGHFCGILETRPYMRARAGLTQCLSWRRRRLRLRRGSQLAADAGRAGVAGKDALSCAGLTTAPKMRTTAPRMRAQHD